jgi:hypothetical protein
MTDDLPQGNLSQFFEDPTLLAVDAALMERTNSQPKRTYLGFSQIGEQCERKLWYGIQPDIPRAPISAQGVRAIMDGFHGETIMANRLRMVPGIQLHTHDENGQQWGFTDLEGKFAGHMDGAVLGLLQAKKTWHVFEHKQVNEKKFNELKKLKSDGEKTALERWDFVYYAQAVLYMSYSGMTRHYLTCATPGGRDYTSVRTDANEKLAQALRMKAKRIIDAKQPPTRINDDPAFYNGSSPRPFFRISL